MACRPLQRRWPPEHFRSTLRPRWEMLCAYTCPSSCSRRNAASGPPRRPEELQGKRRLNALQDLIGHLQQSGRADVIQELYQLVCSHFDRSGRQPLSGSTSRKPPAEEAEQDFKRKLRKILERVSAGELLDADFVLKDVDGELDIEEMQARLDDALLQDVDIDMEVSEDGGAAGYSDVRRMMSEQQLLPLQGSEARPLHERRVMDVEVTLTRRVNGVTWTRPGDTSAHMPEESKSILLSNLPLTATESDVRATLSKCCGEVEHVEVCEELERWIESLRSSNAEACGTAPLEEREGPLRKAPAYTLRYALVQFQTVNAKKRATRLLPRLNGILFKEVWRLKKRTAWKESVVARPAFPQDARLKRALIVRNLPWSLQPGEVLRRVAVTLSSDGSEKCRLELLNCPAFVQGARKLQQFAVEAAEGEIVDDGETPAGPIPEHEMSTSDATWARHGSALVLRFPCFEEAWLARERLRSLSMEGREVVCEFPPWRPVCTAVDSRGVGLDEPVLMDMPIPRASARYGRHGDPVIRFGIAEEECSLRDSDA
ncbi:unnamed protein product [Symbiodinium natans]|uniref:Uncharacterized protein n=1 Tax=Symbiodinium natans TaxID=878477 RepID=A0A812TBZ1_9DINO|nr:unnamed protein product [Symbiodinium natans]